MDLFDNDVLGTSNVRITPEFPAVKKSWRSLRTWYIILPVVLMVLFLGFLFIQQDILYGITDKVFGMAFGGASASSETVADADVVEAHTVASLRAGVTHEANVDANHCCLCCGEKLGHKDEDPADHYCDYLGCNKNISECADKNKDHNCDVCAIFMGECKDADFDHKCDYGCTRAFCDHADADINHYCDYCQNRITGCTDADPLDHHCDVCDAYMTPCKDSNKDHKCDYGCDAVMGVCTDANKDHKCDYGCAAEWGIGMCGDSNKDHKCDYGCTKTFNLDKHVDANRDHRCDYGCDQVFGACTDSDINHYCDYGCAKYFGTHSDATSDHLCDYGCEDIVSTCYSSNPILPFLFFCDVCGAPNYPIWFALVLYAIPFILIEVVCLIIWFAKKKRLSRVSIEFYKDIIIYRDGKTEVMRTFNGTYNVAVRQDSRKERRGNYGTVTIFCPGGPAMSMVFSRIDNPHGLAAQLRAMKPKENNGTSEAN